MELLDKFNSSKWSNTDPNTAEGFAVYRVANKGRPGAVAGEFVYAVFSPEGDLKQVSLFDAGKRDPLAGVGSVELRLSDDSKQIVGVMLLGDCVVYN